MSAQSSVGVTQLLRAWSDGDAAAFDQLARLMEAERREGVWDEWDS